MFKEYRKTATVKAKLFEKGDEDGCSCIQFVSECIHKNKYGLFKDCISCDIDIQKKPYIQTLESQKHFGWWNENYICTGIDGEKWLVAKDIFEKTYEAI